MIGLSLLWACSPGPNPETLIDELRVVAAQAEPAEAAPGETLELSIWVADPDAGSGDLLVWPCTNFGEGCLEAEASAAGDGIGPQLVELSADQPMSMEMEVPAVLAGILASLEPEEVFEGSLLWMLACAPGVCPVIEEVRGGTSDWDVLGAPLDWLGTLPMTGVSLAYLPLALSFRDPAERPINPELSPEFDQPPSALAGEASTLRFLVADIDEEGVGYGYASAGGFSNTEFAWRDGGIELDWYAPVDGVAGDVVQLWVVYRAVAGGVAVWTGEASVE